MTDMGDLLNHNNIVIGSRHDPSPYVLCSGQALAGYFLAPWQGKTGRQFPGASTKGNGRGSGTAKFARHLPFYRY